MDEFVKIINNSVVWFCQLSAILVITVGIIKSLTIYIKDALFGADSPAAIQESRLELGHSFSLGLGFLIGGKHSEDDAGSDVERYRAVECDYRDPNNPELFSAEEYRRGFAQGGIERQEERLGECVEKKREGCFAVR